MLKSHHFYKGFMSAILSKIPQRAALANTIAELLDIDKDAVYRRLRGEVNFSFIEMATIAKKLGVSLDSIVEIESMQSRPTQVIMTKHVNPSELDYKMFNDYVNLLKFIKDEPNTKLMESGATLPHNLFYDYEYFTRFYIFCWNQASNDGNKMPFSEIIIPERMLALQKDCCMYSRDIKHTVYVWDRMIFQRLVSNIIFFAKLRLIAEKEVALIKNDMIELLKHLERLAITGKHDETGNKVSIYISDLYLVTNYICIESKNLSISQFKTFLLNAVAALDKEVYEEVKSWITNIQSMATLISVSGEKIRTEFFNTQRNIINTL